MTIGIWGDSIAFGICDEEALGWVGRLRKSLPINDSYHEVYNFGIGGETSKDLLKRFSIEAQAIGPDMIVFAIGINDAKFTNQSNINQVPVEKFTRNLQTLLTQAKNFTKSVTLIGLTRVTDDWRHVPESRFLNEEIQKYNTAVKETAEMNGGSYISMINTINPETDLADGLHPNALGYQKMFEKIKSEFGL